MPWKEVRPMDQKMMFIVDYLKGNRMITELCRLYGISRKTGYKWIGRYESDGFDGLNELSVAKNPAPAEGSTHLYNRGSLQESKIADRNHQAG